MLPTLKTHLTHTRLIYLIGLLAMSASLLLLTGCASKPNAEPLLIGRQLKPTPLPQSIKQIVLQPSNQTRQKGCEWSRSTENILTMTEQGSSFCVDKSTQTGS